MGVISLERLVLLQIIRKCVVAQLVMLHKSICGCGLVPDPDLHDTRKQSRSVLGLHRMAYSGHKVLKLCL